MNKKYAMIIQIFVVIGLCVGSFISGMIYEVSSFNEKMPHEPTSSEEIKARSIDCIIAGIENIESLVRSHEPENLSQKNHISFQLGQLSGVITTLELRYGVDIFKGEILSQDASVHIHTLEQIKSALRAL